MEDEDSSLSRRYKARKTAEGGRWGGGRGECVMKEQTIEIIVLETMSLTIELSWMNRQWSFESMRLKFTGIVGTPLWS